MKKVIPLFLSLLLCVSVVFGLVACGGSDDESTPSSVESSTTRPSDSNESNGGGQSEDEAVKFERDYYTVEQYTSITVSVPDFKGKTVVYKSSDPSVATVDNNGLVYGLTVGQTTVTAECGGEKATCTVTVTKMKYSPVLVIEHASVSLNEGDEFSMNVYSTYNGEVLTDDIEYTVSLAEGAATDVAEVSVEGGRVTINALSEGEAEFYVSATVRGKYLNKSFTVKVLSPSLRIKLLMDNVTTDEDGYVMEMATVSGSFGEAELALLAEAYMGRRKVEGATITWTSKDETIAKVEVRNGVPYAVAVKGGEVVFVGTCVNGEDTASINVKVKIIKPIVALETEEVPVISAYGAKDDPENNKLEIESSLIDGKFVQATVDGEVVSVSSEISDGVIYVTLNGDAFPKKTSQLGARKMLIETETLRYELDVEIYSLVVRNEADLKKISEVETELGGGGYFILDNDITISGDEPEKMWFWYDGTNHIIGYDHEFTGIIDGRGYKIKNFGVKHNDAHGFINIMGNGGVLRNVAFVDAVFLGKGGITQIPNGDIAGGVIENVYIGVKTYNTNGQANHGLFGHQYSKCNLTMKNVIVDYTNATVTIGSEGNVNLFGYFNGASFTNVAVAGVPTEYKDRVGTGVEGVYVSYSDDTDNGESIPVSGWDENYWTMKEGSLPTFGAYSEATITIENVTIDLGVSVADGVATAKKATVNVGSEVEDLAEVTVKIDGKRYKGSVSDGVLTFAAPADIYGEKTFTVTGSGETAKYVIEVNAFFITKLIATEADLLALSEIEASLDGNGYYKLANDITMADGNWYTGDENHVIGWEKEFLGTIDGDGYKIIGFEINHVDNFIGFIRNFGNGAVLKNVAFVDAVFNYRSALISAGIITGSGVGTVENVYVGVKSFNNFTQNNHGLFGPAYNQYNFNMKNVIIDYTGSEVSNVEGKTSTVLFGRFGYYASFANVAVIGIPTELKDYVTTVHADNKTKGNIYIEYADGTTNGNAMPVSGWDANYWTMAENALPTFKGVVKQNTITASDVTIDLGVTVTDGVATANNATVDLGSKVEDLDEVVVTIDGVTYSGTIVGGILTFAVPADFCGNKKIAVTGSTDTAEYNITVNALFVTKLIATEADLQSISVIEKALGGKGYYRLTDNITMSETGWYATYWDKENSVEVITANYTIGLEHDFVGTIDGDGYKIVGFTIRSTDKKTSFVSRLGAGGTIKNIAFIDATFKQKGCFVSVAANEENAGRLIENVYIGIKTYDTTGQNKHGLFGETGIPSGYTMKNVIVDYTSATITGLEGTTDVNLFGHFGWWTTFSNVAVIGVPTEYSGYVCGNTGNVSSGFVYVAYAGGTTNGNAMPVSGWDTNYWTMAENALPAFKAKEA